MPILELPALIIEEVDEIAAPPRLALINRDPCPGELALPVDTTLSLELADVGGDPAGGIDRAATQVFVDGMLAFDGSAAASIRPGFDGPRAAVTQAADMLRVVLDSTTPLASEATVLGVKYCETNRSLRQRIRVRFTFSCRQGCLILFDLGFHLSYCFAHSLMKFLRNVDRQVWLVARTSDAILNRC